MNYREKELNRMINKLIEAKNYIVSTDKSSKDLYVKEINDILMLLRAGDKTLSGMYRARNILKIIESIKNSRR